MCSGVANTTWFGRQSIDLKSSATKVGKELYRTIYILCNMKDCEVLELNIQPDHVHLVVIVPPEAIDFDVDGRPERTQCNPALQSFPTYTKEVVGQSFLGKGILCRYGRGKRRNYQAIREVSG